MSQPENPGPSSLFIKQPAHPSLNQTSLERNFQKMIDDDMNVAHQQIDHPHKVNGVGDSSSMSISYRHPYSQNITPGYEVEANKNHSAMHKNIKPFLDDYAHLQYSPQKIDIINKIIQQKKDIKLLEAMVSSRQRQSSNNIHNLSNFSVDQIAKSQTSSAKDPFNFVPTAQPKEPHPNRKLQNSSFSLGNQQKQTLYQQQFKNIKINQMSKFQQYVQEQSQMVRDKSKVDRITSLLLADHPSFNGTGVPPQQVTAPPMGITASVIPTRASRIDSCSQNDLLWGAQSTGTTSNMEQQIPYHKFMTPVINCLSHDSSHQTLLKQTNSQKQQQNDNAAIAFPGKNVSKKVNSDKMIDQMENRMHLITTSLVGKFQPKTSANTIHVQKEYHKTPSITPSKSIGAAQKNQTYNKTANSTNFQQLFITNGNQNQRQPQQQPAQNQKINSYDFVIQPILSKTTVNVNQKQNPNQAYDEEIVKMLSEAPSKGNHEISTAKKQTPAKQKEKNPTPNKKNARGSNPDQKVFKSVIKIKNTNGQSQPKHQSQQPSKKTANTNNTPARDDKLPPINKIQNKSQLPTTISTQLNRANSLKKAPINGSRPPNTTVHNTSKMTQNNNNRPTSQRQGNLHKSANVTQNQGGYSQNNYNQAYLPVSSQWQVQQNNLKEYQNKDDIFNPDNYSCFGEFFKSMTKHFNLDNPVPFISARSWIMMNMDTKEVMYAKNQTHQRQVASLTKIMTACVILDLMDKYRLDPDKIKIKILEMSTTPVLGGTSADLLKDDELSVTELMYGMMLPSGNDAAQSMAIYFGNLMLKLQMTGQKTNIDKIDANVYAEEYAESDEEAAEHMYTQEFIEVLPDSDKNPMQLNPLDAISPQQQFILLEPAYKQAVEIQPQTIQLAPEVENTLAYNTPHNNEEDNKSFASCVISHTDENDPTPNFHTFDGQQPDKEEILEQFSIDGDEIEINLSNVPNVADHAEPKQKTKLEIKVEECLKQFYDLMNDTAEEQGLKMSHFNVAHGMHHDNNYSTAYDIAKLSCYAMTKPFFARVVNEQAHECESTEVKGHVYKWENTNQLLKEGYNGIKTGITPSAGPCLSASTTKDGYNVVVVVLSCCSMESRWYEVPKLVNWGVKKIIKINQSSLRPKMKKKLIKSLCYI